MVWPCRYCDRPDWIRMASCCPAVAVTSVRRQTAGSQMYLTPDRTAAAFLIVFAAQASSLRPEIDWAPATSVDPLYFDTELHSGSAALIVERTAGLLFQVYGLAKWGER